MKISFRKADVGFVALWVIAALAARLLFDLFSPSLPAGWFWPLALSALGRGLFQGLALRGRLNALHWGLLTAAGVLVYGALANYFQPSLTTALQNAAGRGETAFIVFVIGLQLVQGAVIGVFQWFALKPASRQPDLWVLASALAFGAGMALNLALLDTPLADRRELLAAGLAGLVGGLALVGLLRRAPENSPELQPEDA